MKNFLLGLFALVIFGGMISSAQVPQKISYQGLLTTGAGTPVADGNYDLKFEIFNLPSGGTLRHTETHTGVFVQKGTFSLALGPLPAIFSESLYVEVTALAGPGIGSPLTFSPRSELTSAPYALQSLSLLGPNCIATGVGSIAGGSNNRAHGNYSVVSGGGGANPSDSNSTIGDYAAVGGGRYNSAGAYSATVGGGEGNRASGFIATIGGGATNIASSDMSTVGGGWLNVSSEYRSTVGGGERDTASGYASTVPGGFQNTASGFYSFAAGRQAKAYHSGTFVWGDNSSMADFVSTGDNQFLIRAGGGVGIGTTNPSSTLHVAGSVTTDSYTKLGSDAPAIKMKKLTGTTSSDQFGGVQISHGLTQSKILSIDVMVDIGGNTYVHAGYTNSPGLEFNWYSASGSVDVVNLGSNSINILSKPIRILITYEE